MLHARTPTLHAPREMGGGGPARPLLKSSGRLRPCCAKVACTSLPAPCAWTWQCLCVSRRTTRVVAVRIPAEHRRPAPPCLQHEWVWQCFCSTKLHRAWWQPRPAPPAFQLLVRLAPGGGRVVCRVGQIHMWQAQATVFLVEPTVYRQKIRIWPTLLICHRSALRTRAIIEVCLQARRRGLACIQSLGT